MKHKTLKNELKGLDTEALELKIDELRREFLTLRLQAATSSIKSFPSHKRKLRRAIACGLTLLNKKKMQPNV